MGHVSVSKPEVGGSRLPTKLEVAPQATYGTTAGANLPQGYMTLTGTTT